jgi:phosphoglycolate phosphatase-like HAD superfamily hydrolase
MRTNGRALPRGADLRLVIFDCDGVLFDSRAANVAFYSAVLDTIGGPSLDAEGERLCHSLAGSQLLNHLLAHDPALHRRASEVLVSLDYGPFYELMRPARNLEACLARLVAHCQLAMATNRGRTVAGVVSRFGLDAYLRTWVGVLDVPRPKPAPDVIAACLARCDVPAASAVYVGDSRVDCEAARAAGVAYVGIGSESGADQVLAELGDLPGLLLG